MSGRSERSPQRTQLTTDEIARLRRHVDAAATTLSGMLASERLAQWRNADASAVTIAAVERLFIQLRDNEPRRVGASGEPVKRFALHRRRLLSADELTKPTQVWLHTEYVQSCRWCAAQLHVEPHTDSADVQTKQILETMRGDSGLQAQCRRHAKRVGADHRELLQQALDSVHAMIRSGWPPLTSTDTIPVGFWAHRKAFAEGRGDPEFVRRLCVSCVASLAVRLGSRVTIHIPPKLLETTKAKLKAEQSAFTHNGNGQVHSKREIQDALMGPVVRELRKRERRSPRPSDAEARQESDEYIQFCNWLSLELAKHLPSKKLLRGFNALLESRLHSKTQKEVGEKRLGVKEATVSRNINAFLDPINARQVNESLANVFRDLQSQISQTYVHATPRERGRLMYFADKLRVLWRVYERACLPVEVRPIEAGAIAPH